VFSNRGVSFRIFQPKEIKGSLGTFGPPIFIPPNTQCCIPTLLREYLAATTNNQTVSLPTGRNLSPKEEQRLFVSVNPPFLFIKAHTIASLGSKLLDTLQYDGTSHVLRGMAASHMLKAGASKEAVIDHMNTSLTNFSKFYFRPPTQTLFHVRTNASLLERLWAWCDA
jgi:hypothetical protein